jgi:short-subunit dehydrogenase
MRTVLMARRADLLEGLARELTAAGAPSVAWPLDLNDIASIESAAPEVLATHGPAEVLVNNAGFGLYLPFLELTPAQYDELMRVNFTAAITLTRVLLPAMLQRKRGCVINITSMSARFGPWGHSLYAASKAALATWTQTMAIEHENTGVHFCAVYPGIVDTPYFQKPTFRGLFEQQRKRVIPPEAVAREVVKLLDHPRIDLCVPRHYRLIDWIKAVSPALVQRMVSKESRPRGT